MTATIDRPGTPTDRPQEQPQGDRGPAGRLRGAGAAVRRALRSCWARPRVAGGVAAGLVVLWALLAGWWMPRGPLTTGQALWSLALSIMVGVAAAALTRSRWAIVLAPVAFAAVFELVRLDLTGPTVDRPQLTTYGLLALAVGRGFHGLVSLLPMAWGAALGAAVARRWADAPVEHRPGARHLAATGLRRATAVLVGLGLLVLTAGLARPASTSEIRGPTGERLPGSVAELTSVRLDGRDHPLMIRGHNADNPVLLFLAGGPGGSELGAMRRHLPALEEHFTVATWDQRGTGKAYPGLDPTGTISLEGYVEDTIAVTDHLRERFGQDQIYLVGQSWGSALGVLAVQQAPDRYRAFIGVGQMVSMVETDQILYEDTLAWAQRTGRSGLAGDLVAIGPPPWESMLDYETGLSHEHEVYPYDRSGNHEGLGGFSENFLVPEYALIEQVHLLAGFMDTFDALYPQLQDLDLRVTATDLPIPAFFVQGAHEADARARPFEEWYPMLEAPAKDVTYLDTSGHRPMFEQPDEFVAYLVGTVLDRS
jgi:proline iminopeptidase